MLTSLRPRPAVFSASHFHVLRGALVVASATLLFGQTDQPASSNATITMSPFEVSVAEDQGYEVARSVTGTRVASDLIELPYNVNVVTNAFMEDFLADTPEEQFAYVSSFAPEEDSINAYSLRGFRTNFQLRDGFARSGFFSTATLSRAEVIKGPAAAVYGRTQPGGVVNYITKKPQDRARTQLAFALGTDQNRRATLHNTGTVFKNDKFKVRYRVDVDYRHEEYGQAGQVAPYSEDRLVSTVWDVTFNQDRTKIQFSADSSTIDRVPVTRAPILWNPRANGAAGEKSHLGLAVGLDKLGYDNIKGTVTERAMDAANLTFEHRFSDHLTFRIGGDYADRRLVRRVMSMFVRRFDINTRGLLGRQPQYETSDEQFNSLQTDLLASFWLGKTEHKLLLTGDYFQQRTFQTNWRLNQVRPARVAPALRPLAAVNDPRVNETYMPAPPTGTNENSVLRPIEQLGQSFPDIVPGGLDSEGRPFQQTTNSRRQLTTRGVFGSWRMAAFQGKVITLLGGRYEESGFFRDNINVATVDSFTNTGFTPSVGLNVYIHPQATFFTNYSRSYYPSLRSGFDSDGDAIEGGLPNEEGAGTDIGIKTRLFDARVIASLTYFTLERKNVAYLVDFEPGTDGAAARFDQRYGSAGLIEGDGVELDFSFRPWKALYLFGAYSYNNTVVKEAGYDANLVGRRWQNAPSTRAALGFTYSLAGTRLRGLTFNGGFRYEGDSVFSNGSPVRLTTDIFNARTGNDGRREMLNPSYTNFDLGASYQWRTTNRWRHRVQLNVKNVVGNDTYRQGGLPAPPRRIIVTYRLDL